MNIREVEEYVKYQIANTPVKEYPYPHFFVENVFPDEYYQDIQKFWPGADRFKSITETGRVGNNLYKERHIVSLRQLDKEEQWEGIEFWQSFAEWFTGPTFLQFLIQQYQGWITKVRTIEEQISVAADALIVQDHTNYAIGPHTDVQKRLVSTLFYCPADDSQSHLGTSVYVPKDSSVPLEIGGIHYPHDKFIKVYTMPFIPNSMFGFVISPNSFHGVDPITDEDVQRNVILHIAKYQQLA